MDAKNITSLCDMFNKYNNDLTIFFEQPDKITPSEKVFLDHLKTILKTNYSEKIKKIYGAFQEQKKSGHEKFIKCKLPNGDVSKVSLKAGANTQDIQSASPKSSSKKRKSSKSFSKRMSKIAKSAKQGLDIASQTQRSLSGEGEGVRIGKTQFSKENIETAAELGKQLFKGVSKATDVAKDVYLASKQAKMTDANIENLNEKIDVIKMMLTSSGISSLNDKLDVIKEMLDKILHKLDKSSAKSKNYESNDVNKLSEIKKILNAY